MNSSWSSACYQWYDQVHRPAAEKLAIEAIREQRLHARGQIVGTIFEIIDLASTYNYQNIITQYIT